MADHKYWDSVAKSLEAKARLFRDYVSLPHADKYDDFVIGNCEAALAAVDRLIDVLYANSWTRNSVTGEWSPPEDKNVPE